MSSRLDEYKDRARGDVGGVVMSQLPEESIELSSCGFTLRVSSAEPGLVHRFVQFAKVYSDELQHDTGHFIVRAERWLRILGYDAKVTVADGLPLWKWPPAWLLLRMERRSV